MYTREKTIFYYNPSLITKTKTVKIQENMSLKIGPKSQENTPPFPYPYPKTLLLA